MRLLLAIAAATVITNAAAKTAKTALASVIVQNVIADARTKKHANAKKTDIRFSKSSRRSQRAIVTVTAIANKKRTAGKKPAAIKRKSYAR